jgi:hypothetical protein
MNVSCTWIFAVLASLIAPCSIYASDEASLAHFEVMKLSMPELGSGKCVIEFTDTVTRPTHTSPDETSKHPARVTIAATIEYSFDNKTGWYRLNYREPETGVQFDVVSGNDGLWELAQSSDGGTRIVSELDRDKLPKRIADHLYSIAFLPLRSAYSISSQVDPWEPLQTIWQLDGMRLGKSPDTQELSFKHKKYDAKLSITTSNKLSGRPLPTRRLMQWKTKSRGVVEDVTETEWTTVDGISVPLRIKVVSTQSGGKQVELSFKWVSVNQQLQSSDFSKDTLGIQDGDFVIHNDFDPPLVGVMKDGVEVGGLGSSSSPTPNPSTRSHRWFLYINLVAGAVVVVLWAIRKRRLSRQ